jgi:hypothetical protein
MKRVRGNEAYVLDLSLISHLVSISFRNSRPRFRIDDGRNVGVAPIIAVPAFTPALRGVAPKTLDL